MDFKDLELNFKKFDEILQKKGWTVEKLETNEGKNKKLGKAILKKFPGLKLSNTAKGWYTKK